ncbi:hypothetical protein [Mesorhizobium sp. B2-7-2]|uniref:hypothetical protein n=1 Tax=Mesorhizobium sp. B2-7-2 TaxID=2589908 RepID=UPI0011271435|nr:hypothetical protein [Mesorhizobium sp. B2-7-2]TPJ28388.1 hypothetical protein FJ425_11710 [Mesorhizobium sp. B2-7-2]
MTKHALLILGAPRSGTSYISQLLGTALNGLPRYSLPANVLNEAGFWEPARIVEIHDRLLTDIGLAWHSNRERDIRRLTYSQLQTYKAELWYEFSRNFSESYFAVMKDPRLSSLLPIWQMIFRDQGVWAASVLVYRPFVEVQSSFQRAFTSYADKAIEVWLRYTLDAELFSRRLPRSIVRYHTAMADWRYVPQKVAIDTGIEFHTAVKDRMHILETIPRRELRHFDQPRSSSVDEGPLHSLATRLEALIEAAAEGQLDISAMDAVRAEFNELVNLGSARAPNKVPPSTPGFPQSINS